jgi:hypothetical protein
MVALCAGMLRACSTWQYLIVRHIVETKLGGLNCGYAGARCSAELSRADNVWRCAKIHDPIPLVEALFTPELSVVFYTHRDLREVVYSLMVKRRVTFDQLVVEQKVITRLLRNDRFWRSHRRVLIQSYDSITRESHGAINEIAAHLGVTLAAADVAMLSEKYSLSSNQLRAQRLKDLLIERGVDLEDPKNAHISDPATKLHWNHIDAGRSGNWRDLSDSDKSVLNEQCSLWLSENGYKI